RVAQRFQHIGIIGDELARALPCGDRPDPLLTGRQLFPQRAEDHHGGGRDALLHVQFDQLPVRERVAGGQLDGLLEARHRALDLPRGAVRLAGVKPDRDIEADVELRQIQRLPVLGQLPDDLVRKVGGVVRRLHAVRISYKHAATASRARAASIRSRPRLHSRLPMTTSTASPAGETAMGPLSNSTSSICGPPADASVPKVSHPIRALLVNAPRASMSNSSSDVSPSITKPSRLATHAAMTPGFLVSSASPSLRLAVAVATAHPPSLPAPVGSLPPPAPPPPPSSGARSAPHPCRSAPPPRPRRFPPPSPRGPLGLSSFTPPPRVAGSHGAGRLGGAGPRGGLVAVHLVRLGGEPGPDPLQAHPLFLDQPPDGLHQPEIPGGVQAVPALGPRGAEGLI